MALETGTYINDLDISNPTSSDFRNQGDDHMRLIKTVLKNTFPTATAPFRFPTASGTSGNLTITQSQQFSILTVNTSGGNVTLTMPSLAAGDAGWHITIWKSTSDSNPVYIQPPSGTINGYSKVRRSISNQPFMVFWTGSVWVAQRQNTMPLASTPDFYSDTLPQGHLWANGQTFVAADFVELNALIGNVLPDLRGRTTYGKDNMGGASAANRITSGGSGINGTALGATGGTENVTMARANLPQTNVSVDIPSGQGNHGHTGSTDALKFVGTTVSGSGLGLPTVPGSITINSNTLPQMSGNFDLNGNVSQTAIRTMPPGQIMNKIVVAE